MKVMDLIEHLYGMGAGASYQHTCDTVKAGNPNQPLTKVATAMFATPQVISDAVAFGAQLLIVHEPLYYNHMDHIAEDETDPILLQKKKLVEDSGLVICRFHDHAHHHSPDVICRGELTAIDLPGVFEEGPYYAVNRYHLETPMTARELGRRLEQHLHISHIRLIGSADLPFTRISCCFGTPGHLRDEIRDGQELILCGEISEWSDGEYIRDAAQMGHPVAALVMGHIGSERDGMLFLGSDLARNYPELSVCYIECGEVYTYPEIES